MYNTLMSFTKRSCYGLFVILSLFIVPGIIYAQGDVPAPCLPAAGRICNPLGNTNTIPAFIKIILEGALKVGIPIIALAVIYCGFLFVAAQGNPEKLGKAKDALLYTLIGAGILLGSLAIAELISATIKSVTS